ncbi:uncharacterized protein METZ01_LOCUS231459, partial [marine metagenome]
MKSMTWRLVLAIAAIVAVGPLSSAEKDAVKSDVSTGLRPFFERFDADRGNLNRFYNIPLSGGDHKRRLAFYQEQQDALKKLDFDGLSRDGQVDYLLLRNELSHTRRKILRERELDQEVLPLMPFWKPIVSQLEAHRRLEPVD